MAVLKPDYVPRMEGLDALRGFALMGLYLVHMPEQYELYWAHPATTQPDMAIHDWVFGLFAGKSFSMLALCFGVSFFIIMDRAAKRGTDFSLRFIWRLMILFVLGWLHGLIYKGDVLQVLAPMGLVLLVFDRVKSNAVLIGIAALCFLQLPMLWQVYNAAHGAVWANQPPHYWSDPSTNTYIHGTFSDMIRMNLFEGQLGKWWYYIEQGRLTQIIGLNLVGLVLGRVGYFEGPERFRLQSRFVLVGAVTLAIGIHFAKTPLIALIPQAAGQFMARGTFGTVADGLTDLSLMTIYLIVFMGLYHRFAHRLLNLLAPVGRMTLTLYVGQSLIWVPVFYGFGLSMHDKLNQLQCLYMAIAFFIAQVAFAHLWFRHFLYGPLEWIWRAATYLTLKVPFKRSMASA